MLLSWFGQPRYKLLLQLLCITLCLLICCFIYKLPDMTPPIKIYVPHRLNHKWDQSCQPGYSYKTHKSKTLEEQQRRHDHVTEVCSKTQHKRRFRIKMVQNILVDDYHHILYCVIPKAACTTWKKFFLRISPIPKEKRSKIYNVHDWTTLRKAGYNYLHTYNRSEIHHRIDNYFKFMFVRDPYERLLSAYREKFQLHNKYTRFFHRRFGRTIIARHRMNATYQSLRTGSDVSFQEFIQYLLELKDRDEEFNPHWDFYHNLCHPCTIQYDFIGKLQTMKQDSQFIMQKISNSSKCQKLPRLFISSPTTGYFIDRYYSQLSRTAIDNLKELYSLDFQLFNYSEQPLQI